MGAILKILVNRSRLIIKKLFGEEEQESRLSVVKPTPDKGLYRNIVILLKANPDFPACRTDARMLHRRLRQYQRLGWRRSSEDREAALKRLVKQWKRVVRNKMKKTESENHRRHAIEKVTTGKIIPVSYEPEKQLPSNDYRMEGVKGSRPAQSDGVSVKSVLFSETLRENNRSEIKIGGSNETDYCN